MTTVNVGATALELYNGVITNGGATVDAVHPGKATPTAGYAVSLEGYEWQVSTKGDLTAIWDAISYYLRAHRAQLAVPGHYAGAWKESDDIVTLDVTRILSDLDDAIAFGKANRQRAIYDIANNNVIELGE